MTERRGLKEWTDLDGQLQEIRNKIFHSSLNLVFDKSAIFSRERNSAEFNCENKGNTIPNLQYYSVIFISWFLVKAKK